MYHLRPHNSSTSPQRRHLPQLRPCNSLKGALLEVPLSLALPLELAPPASSLPPHLPQPQPASVRCKEPKMILFIILLAACALAFGIYVLCVDTTTWEP